MEIIKWVPRLIALKTKFQAKEKKEHSIYSQNQ